MALVVKDRVKVTTSTTGTGSVSLGSAALGYQDFTAVGDGNTTYYTIAGGSEWEVGIGTYTAAGPTLSRDTVLSSSNSGSLVDFSSGTKDGFVTYPADKAVYEEANGDVVLPADLSVVGAVDAGGLVTGDNFNNTDVFYYNTQSVTANTTIGGTENAMSVGPITIDDDVTVTVSDGGAWSIV
jgi:hypothetical protein